MKCLLDANIILDVLCDRAPYYEDSDKILKLCETGLIDGYITTLSFANIVYILRKELDPQRVKETFAVLRQIVSFLDLSVKDLEQAANMLLPDFEDALQIAIAARSKADCIITRNPKHYVTESIVVYTPEEFLKTHVF